MISASHNPFGDNGLKAFGGGRREAPRLDRATGRGADPRPATSRATARSPPRSTGPRCSAATSAISKSVLAGDRLRGRRIVSTAPTGRRRRSRRRSSATTAPRSIDIGCSPDGKNINLGCGSTHLDGLADAVKQRDADMGLAFDGDADRCLAVDRRGRVVDGDHILYITGRRLNAGSTTPRRLGGGDDHEQLLAGGESGPGRDPAAPSAGRRQVRARAHAGRERDPRRRAVRTHHLPRTLHDRRRHPHGAVAAGHADRRKTRGSNGSSTRSPPIRSC